MSKHKKKKALSAYMRANPTPGEVAFSRIIAATGLDHIFMVQVVLFGFIADFYAKSLRLCVEIDGPGHKYTKEYDLGRSAIFASHGIRVIRFSNHDVFENPERVFHRLQEAMTLPKLPDVVALEQQKKSRAKVAALGNLLSPSQREQIVFVPRR